MKRFVSSAAGKELSRLSSHAIFLEGILANERLKSIKGLYRLLRDGAPVRAHASATPVGPVTEVALVRRRDDLSHWPHGQSHDSGFP